MFKFNRIVLIAACCGSGLFAAGNADQSFVTKASQGGAAEVKLGQLAQERASNQKVKDFGKQMSEDHSKAGDELNRIAQQKNLRAPSEMTAQDDALMKRLQGLSGPAFDKEYMSAMVKDHEEDIAEFQKEANSGSDSDVKTFASKTLPTLNEHLRMAKEAAATVGAAAQ
jgi:putative membrane protein